MYSSAEPELRLLNWSNWKVARVFKHSKPNDYKATKPYIDIADDSKVTAIDKFNRL